MIARFLLCLIAVALSSDATAQWLPKNNGLDFERIRSVHFISASTGFAVGDTNSIYKTDNGGEQWERIDMRDCGGCIINYNRVEFLSPVNGFIWGIDTTRRAKIVLSSTDAGTTWQLADSSIANVAYISEDFGYRFESNWDGNTAKITTDLGRTWQRRWGSTILLTHDVVLIHGKFADSLNAVVDDLRIDGHANTQRQDHHYKRYTTDGGKTWHNSILQPRLFSDLGNHRWLGLRQDTVVRSDDGGHTWPGISIPGYPIVSFQPITYSIVYATLGRATDVARSNDAGVTWTREYVADSLTSVVRMQRFVEGGQETLYLLARGTTWAGAKVFKQTNAVSSVKPVKQSSSLRVSISPDGNSLTVRSDRQSKEPLMLQDALGRTVRKISEEKVATSWTIDLTGIPPGAYFLTAGDQSAKLLIP